MTNEQRQQEALDWYFDGGYATMNKLQQVDFLHEECGYSYDGAWDLVYGSCEY